MSRSGVFYAVKAMERTAAGTPAAGGPAAPARQAADSQAPSTGRPDGGISSRARQVLTAMHRSDVRRTAVGGRRRLRGAARAE
jgi:hypothetical protein